MINYNDKTRTTIYIEKDMYKKLKYISVGRDMKINDSIKEALNDYIKKNVKYIPKF